MDLLDSERAIVNYFKPIKGFMPLRIRLDIDNPKMLIIEGQISVEDYKNILEDYERATKRPSDTHKRNVPSIFLWDANPNCNHEIVNASGGGIKCNKCGGWICY